jgi:hypothetical protein
MIIAGNVLTRLEQPLQVRPTAILVESRPGAGTRSSRCFIGLLFLNF